MNYTDTICYKVKTAQEMLEKAVETGNLNVELMAELLVNIQSNAISMESALKTNKVLRLRHKIDAEYREMMKEKTTPSDINELRGVNTRTKNNGKAPLYELTLVDLETKKILYRNKIFTFLLSAVERIDDVDAAGMIDGQVQVLVIGSDLGLWFAFDQLKQKMAHKFSDLAVKMAGTIQSGGFLNREQRRKLVKHANGNRTHV